MARTGDIMVEEGLVSAEDVNEALSIQEKNQNALGQDRERLLGMVLCDLNLITPLDNYCVLEKHQKLVDLKSFLARKNIVSISKLDEIEVAAAQKGIPFISYLLEQQVIPKPTLQHVLFDLFRIPFRSVSDIVFDEQSRKALAFVIDQGMAAKHKIIPLQISGNTLTVGITDPQNLFLLRALDQKFPQYRLNPIFIPFSGFTWFYKMLYKEDLDAKGPRKVSIPVSKKDRSFTGAVNSSVEIRDPELERDAVARLYDQYERFRQGRAGLNKHDENRKRNALFFEFICESHSDMVARFGCSAVAFSLKQKGSRLLIIAEPVAQSQKENK